MAIVTIKKESRIPKYKQIVVSIEEAVVNGALKKGDKLPSLNSIKNNHALSRDTVLMAFNELKMRGIVQSIVGKGYYVTSEDVNVARKIFLLFDEFNSFKEDLYNSFLANLRANIQVDIFFHHFNYDVFSKLIHDNAGAYSYYIIMPANLKNVKPVLKRLPKGKVYILDQTREALLEYPSVHQNFKMDMYRGLCEGLPLIKKYKKIILLFSPSKQPKDIRSGFELFCNEYKIDYTIVASVENRTPKRGDLFIILEDKNLIRVIKKLKAEELILAKDVGIISYNDTLLKEIVEGGITTISTNFNLMGEKLAQMLLKNEFLQVENPSRLIIRKSI